MPRGKRLRNQPRCNVKHPRCKSNEKHSRAKEGFYRFEHVSSYPLTEKPSHARDAPSSEIFVVDKRVSRRTRFVSDSLYVYLVTPMISRLKRKRERDGTREDPFSDNRGRKVKITRFHILLYRGNSKISIRVLANYYRIVVQFNRATWRLMIKIDG